MTSTGCTTCRTFLPDLLFEPEFRLDAEAARHMAACPACRAELEEMRATMALMDEWTAPEPSPYFDTRVHAQLRAAQAAAPESLWQRLADTLRFGTGRSLRPALAGAFVFVALLGGGTAATLWEMHTGHAPAVSSPAVNDLKIYDNNAQAIQQMDLLDEPGSDNGPAAPQS